jgi:hypothetical protein
LREISYETARNCYRRWHYLGNTGFLATYSFGAYFDGSIMGAISFHPPSARETIRGLFQTEEQAGFWEIGRLAMSDDCPPNSESRFIAIAIRLLKRRTQIKAIITYADTAAGHKGIIYRAAGFVYLGLTAPKADFWVDGKIQQRGKTRGIQGKWKARSRKHLYVKTFEDVNVIAKHRSGIGKQGTSPRQ